MVTLYKIAVMPGDGIGSEVIAEAIKVLKFFLEELQGPGSEDKDDEDDEVPF